MPASEPFSNVDAVWLPMDEPTNMAMIVSISLFDRRLDFDRLKATIAERLLRVKRFRQKVQEPWLHIGTPHWEIDREFDLNAHVLRFMLAPPGDQAALQELVGQLMATPLDYNKPLWQMHLVENYGRGCALITRLHHCMGDGIALVRVLLLLTDEKADAVWHAPSEKSHATHGGFVRESTVCGFADLIRPVTKMVAATWQTAETVAHEGMETLVHPERIGDAALLGASGTLALSKLLLISPDQKTIFKGKCRVPKRVAWSQPIRLGEVKALGQAVGATVNDILLACVTGALRRYLDGRGELTAGLNIRAVVPVNLRPLDEPLDLDHLGNRFGLVFLSLPIGIVNPRRWLDVLKRRMDEIKDSPEAFVAFGILDVIGMTPIEIEKIITKIFGAKGTAVMTNVPGPQKMLYLAGVPIRAIMFWAPTTAQLGLGVSILSYAGDVILGVSTDAGLVPDPGTIVSAFRAEFDRLKRQLLPTRAAAKMRPRGKSQPATRGTASKRSPLASGERKTARYPVQKFAGGQS